MTGPPPALPKQPSRLWRVALWLSLLFVATLTVVAGILVVVHYREDTLGEREWAETRRDLAARGESLDVAHFIPPPVPDEQNLAMAPLFVWLYRYQVDPATGLLTFGERTDDGKAFMHAVDFGRVGAEGPKFPRPPGWDTGHPTDLAAFQQYYRARKDFPQAPAPQAPAEDVLLALTRFDPTLDEISRAAAERPLLRTPINWTQRPAWEIKVPHGELFLALVRILQIRACAHLAAGHTDDAFRDVILGLRLVRAMYDEHLLLTHTITTSCLSLQLEPIWNGLKDRRWSPAQLGEIQARLGEFDLLAGYLTAVRLERAVFIAPMVETLHKPGQFESLYAQRMPEGQKLPLYFKTFLKAIPRGWAERAVAVACRKTQEFVVDSVDVTAHRLNAELLESLETEMAQSSAITYNELARLCLPIYISLGRRSARVQTYLDEAVTACALERYYLDHQSYPDDLATLTTAYLPRVPADIISGDPLQYEPVANGRYRLWGVGWDGEDDGGEVAWKDYAKPTLDEKKGDWVWQYEPLSPP